jgi:hypothetical protein
MIVQLVVLLVVIVQLVAVVVQLLATSSRFNQPITLGMSQH